MKLRLYHYWRSSCSWRVRWAFALKKIPCEYVAVNLLEDESENESHLRRNPMGVVPVLEFTESRFRFLGESIAIVEWSEEAAPEPRLLPGSPEDRARIRQLAQLINAGTQPLQNVGVSQLHSADQEEQKRWNQHWTRKGLGAYETLVKETAGIFSFGDQITLADLCLIPQCYNAQRQNVPLDLFPTIKRIHENAQRLPSYQESEPDRFKPKSI